MKKKFEKWLLKILTRAVVNANRFDKMIQEREGRKMGLTTTEEEEKIYWEE